MTAYTDITIGRLTLRETFEMTSNVSAGTDTQSIVLSGEESFPPLTLAQVKQRREDILGLQNRLVPIRFGTKSDHDGWYKITDVNTAVRDYQGEVRAFTWGINADFIGPENGVDLESRLTGVARINDFGLTGEKWHGVPFAAASYYGGTLTSFTRATIDGGSVQVWRSVAASTNPRWAINIANYQIGRSRVLMGGVERVGTNIDNMDPADWVLTNGVISASMAPGASTTWRYSVWDGSAWDANDWGFNFISFGSSPQTAFAYATILRNDYEMCTIRLLDDSAGKRRGVDLSVRRGSRFVECRAWSTESSTFGIWRSAIEAGTSPASSGYVRATSDDANGNRYVVGSARAFTAQTASGGLSKSSTTSLDFFIGAEVGGSAATSGNQAADLAAQYLTAMSEVTVAGLR